MLAQAIEQHPDERSLPVFTQTGTPAGCVRYWCLVRLTNHLAMDASGAPSP
jgi:hypothetical protein